MREHILKNSGKIIHNFHYNPKQGGKGRFKNYYSIFKKSSLHRMVDLSHDRRADEKISEVKTKGFLDGFSDSQKINEMNHEER